MHDQMHSSNWIDYRSWVDFVRVDFIQVDLIVVDFIKSWYCKSWSHGSWSYESWSRVCTLTDKLMYLITRVYNSSVDLITCHSMRILNVRMVMMAHGAAVRKHLCTRSTQRWKNEVLCQCVKCKECQCMCVSLLVWVEAGVSWEAAVEWFVTCVSWEAGLLLAQVERPWVW